MCEISNVDSEGNVIKNPLQTAIVNMVERGEQVTGKDLFKALVKAGYIHPSGKLVKVPVRSEETGEIYQSHKLAVEMQELNGYLAVNYGAGRPVFDIVGYMKKRGNFGGPSQRGVGFFNTHDYYVSIDESQLNNLSRVSTPIILEPYMLREMKAMTANVTLYENRGGTSQYREVINPVERAAKVILAPVVEAAVEEGKAIKTIAGRQMSMFDTNDSRALSKNEDIVNIDKLETQISKLQAAFREAGQNIEVIIDPELPVKGRAVVTTDGRKQVILNPNKLTEDTAIHEFGHFLVEMLEDDPILERAFNELKDTELAKQVKERYPEYSEEDYRKELITTAVGLAGAKIERNSPNLFQRIFNRIVRAIAKKLNIKNLSAVEEIAQKLMDGKIKQLNYSGNIKTLSMESRTETKLEKDFKDTVSDVKIAILDAIRKLKSSGQELNEKAISRLELMYENLETVKTIEQFSDFVGYANSLAIKASEIMGRLGSTYDPANHNATITPAERLDMIKELHTVHTYLSDFYGGVDPSKSLMGKIRKLVGTKVSSLKEKSTPEQRNANPAFAKLTQMEQTLIAATDGMAQVSDAYREVGIPMMVDLLLEYNSFDDLNDQVKSIINNIKTNNRLIALEKDEEFYRLQEKLDKKEITKEEHRAALINLNIEQMKNKEITRETLINELREAQKDKSAFGYLLDPFVYSSQAGLQMFALTLKNKLLEANEDTLETVYALEKVYKAYADYKGSDTNPEKFNEDVLEVVQHEVFDPETGTYKVMNLLSFVQPYDITRYKKALSEEYDRLGKLYNIPEKRDERKAWFEAPANSKKAQSFYKEISAWHTNNSTVSPDAISELSRLRNALSTYNMYYNKAVADNNSDLMAIHASDMKEYENLINKLVNPDGSFKGRAMMPNQSYSNPKYAALQSNKPALDYYNALLAEYRKSQKKVGKHRMVRNSWEDFSYIAPSILSEGLEKIQRDGAISGTKLMLKDQFNFLSTDTNYGDAINANKENRNKVIPVFYVTPTEEKLVTRDIAAAVIQFAGMSNMYEKKAELHSAVMLMSDIIETRETYELNASNNPIINNLSKITGRARYIKKKDVSNNFKHLDEWIKTVFFGETEMQEAFNFKGNVLSGNKLAGSLASLTALNALTFNMLQVGNQLILDNLRLVEEGVTKQFFSTKNLAWAKSTYHLQLQGIGQLKDFEAFADKTKLSQVATMFDALGEAANISNKGRGTQKGFRAIQKIPMGAQSLVENETAMTRMLAVLDSFRGKIKDANGEVIKNDDGTEANVYDLIKLNEATGRYELDSRIANPEALKIKITNRLAGLTKKTNQVKNKFDDAVLQRRWWGKLVMLFRRYFVPSLRKYWGHGSGTLGSGLHRDLELGTVSEGVYHTAFRFLKESWNKKGNVVSVFGAMEKFEQQNMIRFGMNAAFTAIALLAAAILLDDDDDEESTYAQQFFGYQAKRLVTELNQFINPIEFGKSIMSPAASVRPIQNIIDLSMHIITQEVPYMITGDTEGLYYETSSGAHAKGDSKFMAKLDRIVPAISGIEKSKNPEEAAKWFNLGATSFK